MIDDAIFPRSPQTVLLTVLFHFRTFTFEKMLASHFNTVLVDIISEDQTGFMKGHHAFSNLCRLLNVIHSASPSDAEEAYHRVEWEYLFAVLKKFGFGKN